jgi:hypothetical protein
MLSSPAAVKGKGLENSTKSQSGCFEAVQESQGLVSSCYSAQNSTSSTVTAKQLGLLLQLLRSLFEQVKRHPFLRCVAAETAAAAVPAAVCLTGASSSQQPTTLDTLGSLDLA